MEEVRRATLREDLLREMPEAVEEVGAVSKVEMFVEEATGRECVLLLSRWQEGPDTGAPFAVLITRDDTRMLQVEVSAPESLFNECAVYEGHLQDHTFVCCDVRGHMTLAQRKAALEKFGRVKMHGRYACRVQPVRELRFLEDTRARSFRLLGNEKTYRWTPALACVLWQDGCAWCLDADDRLTPLDWTCDLENACEGAVLEFWLQPPRQGIFRRLRADKRRPDTLRAINESFCNAGVLSFLQEKNTNAAAAQE